MSTRTRISTNPAKHPPFACALCARELAAGAYHVILSRLSSLRGDVTPDDREASAGVVVCGRCTDRTDAHAAIFPACDVARHCDMHDHSWCLCADRAAAVVWLTAHNLIDPVTEGARP